MHQALNTAGIILPGQEPSANPVEQQLHMMLSQIEMATSQLAQQLHMMGQALDISRLQSGMISNILIDKGIISKEEFDDKYKTDVADKIRQMRAAYEEKLKEAIAEHERVTAKPQKPTPPDRYIKEDTVPSRPKIQDANPSTAVSDVVLPSERRSKIKFKDE